MSNIKKIKQRKDLYFRNLGRMSKQEEDEHHEEDVYGTN